MNKVLEFEDMSIAEMEMIQGAGDVQAETTPVCALAATAAASSGVCAATGAGVAVGATIVLTIKRC